MSSGVNHVEYMLDTGTWTTATSPLVLTGLAEGAHTFAVHAVDNAGNVGQASVPGLDGGHGRADGPDFRVLFGGKSYSLMGLGRDLPWQITGIQASFSEPVNGSSSSLTGSGISIAQLHRLGNAPH